MQKHSLNGTKSKGIAQFDHHDGVMHQQFLSWNYNQKSTKQVVVRLVLNLYRFKHPL